MDTPALVILAVGILMVILVVVTKLKLHGRHPIGFVCSWLALAWLVITIAGEILIGWGYNASCSRFLGCISGFVGYDAFEHLFFGIVCGLLVVWVSSRSERYAVTFKERWKTILIFISLVVLASVVWEMLECAHDAFRVDILHEPFFNFRLHVSLLAQPTNLDTMGDLCASLVGAIIAMIIAHILDPLSLRTKSN